MVFKQYDNYVFRLKCSFDVHATIMIFSTAENEFKLKKKCLLLHSTKRIFSYDCIVIINNK
jgi:hypothetical protein